MKDLIEDIASAIDEGALEDDAKAELLEEACREWLLQIAERETDEDEVLCSHCNGSGEGMYDGTRCTSCKGSGVE